MGKNQKKLQKRSKMKKLLLSMIIFLGYSCNANCQQKAVALAGVGLLSGSIYCLNEAAMNQWQVWDTKDPYQKRTIITCRNNWLKGTVVSFLPGIVLLREATKKNSTIFASGIGASVMFAFASSAYKESRWYHEELVRTANLSFAEQRDKWRFVSVMAASVGIVFCVPIVYDCNGI